VLSVDEDQGFFVLNHSHPLSPKQGYVILDAGATTSAFHLCVRRLVSTARVASCPRVFGVETYQIIPSDIPGASPLRHFFPAALVFLIISFLITTFANARVFRRVVLISASQHQLESQGTNRLVWEELFPMIVVVFHTIIFVSTANACKSAVRRSVGIYKWFIVTSNPATPSASRSPTMLSKFLVVGPLTAAASFVHLPKTVHCVMGREFVFVVV
jgi:hypothetical protein